jgi:transposase
MIPKAAEVRLSPEDRAVLEARVRAPTTAQRDVLRARIVLLAAEGRSTRSIAQRVATMPRRVSLWRGRYAREGLAGLADKPRPGPKPKYDATTGRRILAVLEGPPPAGFGRWTGPLIAAELGDVHEQQVWRFLRDQHFIARYNAHASPFAWTKAGVHQKRFKARRISQLRFRVLASSRG